MEVGGSSSTSCLIAFGDNVNTLCPTMMMPSMTSHNADSNTLFLPLLPTTNIQNLNFHKSPGNSSVMVEERNNCGNNNNNSSTGYYFMGPGYGNHSSSNNNNDEEWSFKAKIMAHPHYHRLLTAYVNCQKIGAPPEVLARLEEACSSADAMGRSSKSSIGDDPSLDQFMEAYCEMLTKYEQELTKPFKEAMLFLSRIESQLKAFTLTSDSACPQAMDINGSSEEEVDVNNSSIDPLAEDRELKGQLLRKYSGYLGSLKQEFMKKRKKGKLPKEARQQLLEWWGRHYKWPYPSESQKLALAESTGLDQKQINNWFINQRKRHWKPSEDMQFVVMDAATAAAHSHYYMDNVLGNPFSMDISSSFL